MGPLLLSETPCGPVCDDYLSLSNGVAILSRRLDEDRPTQSAIAETGAMLLNGRDAPVHRNQP